MLVLGVTTYYEDDEMLADNVSRFHPTVTWMGSATWSSASRSHIDHGLWAADAALVRHNYDYLLGLLELSEARGATTVGPKAELVPASCNDEAFREYFAEHRYMYEDPDDFDVQD